MVYIGVDVVDAYALAVPAQCGHTERQCPVLCVYVRLSLVRLHGQGFFQEFSDEGRGGGGQNEGK